MNYLFLIVIFSILLIIFYAVFIEPYQFVLAYEKVFIKNLPENLNGIKVLHISDLHVQKKDFKKFKFLRNLQNINPDLIIISGDFIDHDDDIDICAKNLKNLNNKNGVFGVLGNHDHYRFTIFDTMQRRKTTTDVNNSEKVSRVLGDYGIKILENTNQFIEINNQKICLIGVGENGSRPKSVRPALPVSLNDSFNILICHYPDVIFDPDIDGVDMVLAGHTHGGQIRFPIIGAIINWSKLPLKFSKGLSVHKNIKMHISQGIGTATLPVRFLCKPGVTVLELINN